MNKSILLILLFALLTGVGFAQKKEKSKSNDPVIMTIDGKPTYKSEFEAIFKKNYKKPAVEKADLEEYIDLFVKFRLRVTEAETLGMDTSKKFINELAGYRKQLAKPYLADREMTDKLLNEAYQRMQKDVRASHILVRVKFDDKPEDTLKAYNKILEIRKRILAGEDFGTVAASKNGSEDVSAATNKGDLGFFTAFQMVYPFESAVYNMNVDDISQPVRTQYGYHLIKKTGERPARGEIRTSHIMIRVEEKADDAAKEAAKTKIMELYQKVKAGEDFGTLAQKFSEDKGSAVKNGELPWFGAGKMVEPFENAAFDLQKDGDVSEPFLTQYGWHIVKRLELKPIPPLKEVENSIKTKIQRDSRSQKSAASFIARLKKEYKFKDLSAKTLPAVIQAVDTTIFFSNWDTTKITNPKAVMGQYTGGKIYVSDFARYLYRNQRKTKVESVDGFVRAQFKKFVETKLTTIEEAALEQKYPDFKLLVKEYRDGILLFELTDKMVWSKAVKDSAGLETYFKAHQSDFMWEERTDAIVFWCADMQTATLVSNMLAEGASVEKVQDKLNAESSLNVRVESGRYEKSKAEWLWNVSKTQIAGPTEVEGKIGVAQITQVLQPEPKALQDCRGAAIAKYQDHLEKEWITALKAKYKVVVNEDVLFSIK